MAYLAESRSNDDRSPLRLTRPVRLMGSPVRSSHSGVESAAGLVACCLAFLAAKSIASNGAVTIDAIEFWLIGVLPYLGAHALSQVAPSETDARQQFGFILSAWLSSLLGFVLLRATLVAEIFDIATIGKTTRLLDPASWLPTLGYATVGLMLAIAWRVFRHRTVPSPPLLTVTFIYCALCLHILLFLVPAF